jgi:hypothetical protein
MQFLKMQVIEWSWQGDGLELVLWVQLKCFSE